MYSWAVRRGFCTGEGVSELWEGDMSLLALLQRPTLFKLCIDSSNT